MVIYIGQDSVLPFQIVWEGRNGEVFMVILSWAVSGKDHKPFNHLSLPFGNSYKIPIPETDQGE